MANMLRQALCGLRRKYLPVWVVLVTAFSLQPAPSALAKDAVFSIQNFPIEAEAGNAVAAKRRAVAQGQRDAFASLLRRLVPVTSYKRLGAIQAEPSAMILGFGVRTEQNSRTEYIARYDFNFSAPRVRAVLRKHGLPFVEEPAQPISIVPIFGVPNLVPGDKAKFGAAKGVEDARFGKAWVNAWKSLDLTNGLTPVQLRPKVTAITPDVIKGALNGDISMTDMLAGVFGQPTVFAFADISQDGKRWLFRLVGKDRVGVIDLTRAYTFVADDPDYSAENAAVVAFKVLEGRWKEVNKPQTVATTTSAGSVGGEPVMIRVEYASPGDWLKLRTYLATLPGVGNFETGALSARGADVTLTYPGGGNALAAQLEKGNLQMYNDGQSWILRTY